MLPTHGADPLVLILAVIDQARREALCGKKAARAWLDQLAADIAHDMPPPVAERLSALLASRPEKRRTRRT